MTVEISEFDCFEVQKIVLSTSLGNAAFLSRPDLAASFAAEQLAAPLPAQIAKMKCCQMHMNGCSSDQIVSSGYCMV